MLQKHPSKNPLRGLDLRGSFSTKILKKSAETPYQTPQANKPYGIQERFEGSKVSDQSPFRLEMHVAFGRVRRKTEPTGPGMEAVIFLKLTLMVRLGNRTYRDYICCFS